MELVFRHVTDEEFSQPPAGEWIFRLRHQTATPVRAMAEYVLNQGVASFPQGAAPLQKIVAPFDPTLDDMLAIEFARRLMAGETLPEGAKSFCAMRRWRGKDSSRGRCRWSRRWRGFF